MAHRCHRNGEHEKKYRPGPKRQFAAQQATNADAEEGGDQYQIGEICDHPNLTGNPANQTELRRQHDEGSGDQFSEGKCERSLSRHSSSAPGATGSTAFPVIACTIRGTCTWHVSTMTLTLRGGVPAMAVPAM